MTVAQAGRPADDASNQPLDRALAVLEFVLSQRGPVSASAVAAATGLPAATTHRLIGQLESRSLLKRVIGSKKLLAGVRLVDLGTQILEGALVADSAHGLLAQLATKIEEHCHLGIISQGEVLYVDSARPPVATALRARPARTHSLHLYWQAVSCSLVATRSRACRAPYRPQGLYAEFDLFPA